MRNTLSNRDSAARSGLANTGAARSDGWAYLPVCFATHVFLEPGEGSLDELLDASRRRLLHRRQPQLVDRQPAAELPVRHGGRLRGQGRQTRPAAEELLLRRRDPAVLGFGRGRRRPAGVPFVRLPVRQGRAQAVGLSQPRRRTHVGTQSEDRSRVMSAQSFEPPVPPDHLLDHLAAAVKTTGADAVEIALLGRAGEYTRFAGERVHQPQDITETQFTVRAIVDGARGPCGHRRDRRPRRDRRSGRTSGPGPREARAGSGCRHGGRARRRCRTCSLWHEDTAAFDGAERGRLAAWTMATAVAADGSAAGMFGRAVTQLAVVNSAGVAHHMVATEASGSLTAIVSDGTVALGRPAPLGGRAGHRGVGSARRCERPSPAGAGDRCRTATTPSCSARKPPVSCWTSWRRSASPANSPRPGSVSSRTGPANGSRRRW